MKIVYIDTETTGLDCTKQELVQLSGVIEKNGQVIEEFNLFAKPRKMNMIQPQALAVQGKSVHELLKYPTRMDCHNRFINVLKKHVNVGDWKDRLVWVGQNPSFDEGFVKSLMAEHRNDDFKLYFDPRLHDLKTVAFAMQCAGKFNPPNLKLQTLAKELGITYDAHDALADAKCLRQIWHIFQGWIKNSVPVQGRLFA